MRVVASSAINKKHRIYHRYGCKYASRIKYDNRLEMSYEQASKKHYKACKCCSGFKGLLNVYRKSFEEFAVKNNISFTYNEEQNSLFVKTEMGFWKIYNPLDYSYSRSYILYHRNSFSPNMTVEQGIKGAFHSTSVLWSFLKNLLHLLWLVTHRVRSAILSSCTHSLTGPEVTF